MATEIDTYIKGPSPSKNPDSQYTYLEQQLTAVENAFKKQKAAIVETSENAQALYENEVIVRATADSALVQTLETLDAKVELNNTTTQATIQNIQTAFADSESATATKLSTLEAKVDTGDANNLALIRDEAKTRATKVDALASKVSSLEASVKTNAADARALITQEATARATGDSAEATSRTQLRAYIDTGLGSQFTVASKGLSATVSGTAGLFLGSSTSSINTASRSYNLWVISKATGTVSYNASYDVYAGTTAASNLATYLNSLDNSVVVVLATYDEPKTKRLTGGLPAAIRRCGGTRAIFGDEDQGQPLRNLFQSLLNRIADTGGYNYYYGLLTSGSSTLTTVAATMLSSSEYVTQHPGSQTNTEFVTMLYSNLYGRSPTSSEQSYWVGVLSGGTSKAQASADFVLASVETWKSRAAYLLVGTPGEGEGSGVEKYVGSVDNDTNAFCSFSFNVRNGRVDGVSGVGSVSAAITNEQIARVSSDNALSSSISTLSANVGNISSNLSDEQIARANADISVAQRTLLTSAGTSNVYAQTTAPSGSIASGSIWLDTTIPAGSTSPLLTPYVYYSGAWRDNSSGSYSQYSGNNATVTQLTTTVNDPSVGLAAQWYVSATTDGAPAGSIKLLGVKSPDGSISKNLIIDANTTINGSLLVAGSVVAEKIADGAVTAPKLPDNVITSTKISDGAITTGKIAANAIVANNITAGTITADRIVTNGIDNARISDNAVSNSAFNQGAGSAQTSTLFLRAGARVSIIANYAGGDNLGLNASSNTLTVSSSYGSVPNNTATIRPVGQVTAAGSYAYINNTNVVTSVVTAYNSSNTTLMTLFSVPSSGTYSFTASANGWGGLTSILVMELSK